MPGPAPKPDSERRRRNAPMANTVKLPAEGRSEPAPAWPLTGDTPAVWHELWALPQAVQWERLGWLRVVARYCKCLELVEGDMPSAAMLAQVSAMEDKLGLTPLAMLRLRWEVSTDPATASEPAPVVALAPRRKFTVAQ